MALSLNGSLSWLGAGLLTLSLGACIAQAPAGDKDKEKEEENETSSKKDDEDGDGSKKEEEGDESNASDGAEDEPDDAEKDEDGQDGSISGTVVDADGEPVKDLGVSVCADEGGCMNPVLTNEDGEFEVKNIFNAWKDLHAMVGSGKDPVPFFAGSILSVHMEKGGEAVKAGQLTFLEIDAKDKGDSFKDVEEKKTFKAGKFSFELDAGEFEPGMNADGTDEELDNQNFAVIEVPKGIWRDDEKEIDGKKVVSIWGLFPFGGAMNEGYSSSIKIEDDLGLDDGAKVVLFEQHSVTGKVSEIGESEVKDGAIELKEGLTQFARLYIAEK